MELLICGALVGVALLAHVVSSALDNAGAKLRAEARAEKENKNSNTKSAFKRLSCVKGILYANGTFYKTFNTGNTLLQDQSGSIELEFIVNLDGCYFGDICINGVSIRTGMPKFSDYESEISYIIGLFNTAASTGVLSNHLVSQAKELIDEYQDFADLLDKGVIMQPNGTADYVWVG